MSNFHRKHPGFGQKPSGPLRLNYSNPFAQHLVGAWIFNEGAGTQVADLTGKNHGTIVNGSSSISWAYGKFGLALDFTGGNNNDRVDLGSIDSNNPLSLSRSNRGSVFSLCSAETSSGFPRLIDKSDGGNASNGWAITVEGTDELRWYWSGSRGASANNIVSPPEDRVGLAAVRTGDTNFNRYYKNGAFFSSINAGSTADFATTTTNAAIGNWNHSSNRNWVGYIYLVYVWDRQLVDADIAALWADPYQLVAPANNFAAWLFEPPGVGPINQTVIPGTLPIAGSTVAFDLTIDQTVNAGTLPISGQTVTFDLTVDQTVNPGTLPISGATVGFDLTIDQTVSPGTLPIVGQSVGFALGFDQTVVPGTLPIVGATVGFDLTIDQTVVPGTLPIVGQTVDYALGINQTVVPGTLPIVGATVGFDLTIDQTVSAGTLPIVGQTVTFDLTGAINQTVVPATLPIVGQAVPLTLTIDQTVTPGTMPIVGQSVGFALGFDQTVVPATVPITGATVGFDLTIDQTVTPGTLPITGQSVGLTIAGPLTQIVVPGTLTITGQTLTLVLRSIEGTLLEDIEEDLGATFFECSGLGFATDFVHAGTTYCGIFTAEATDISERRNPFIETETSNTSAMSRGDVIEVIATPLNAGGTFTIRGLSPDGTGQSTIVLETA